MSKSKVKKQKLSLSDLPALSALITEEEKEEEVEVKCYIARMKKNGQKNLVGVSAVNNILFFDYATEFDQFEVDQNEIKSVWRYGEWTDIYAPKSGKYPDNKPYNDIHDVYKIKYNKFNQFITTERIETFQNEEKHNVVCNTYHTSWTQTETEGLYPRCNLPKQYFEFLLNGGKIE